MRGVGRAGATLAGRFQIERPIGQGGMATVYRAVDLATGEPCAVKLLHAEGAGDAERFAREAELLSQLTHPAIVRHVAHGRLPGGELFLVMEWLDGTDLSKSLARRGMLPAEVVVLVRRVAEGLGAAHARGVVHRDVKPSNVFLPDGEIGRAKILDFGIARLGEGGSMTRTGNLLGTPAYMAPEQARGNRGIDARADVFSLGCILFECLTGRAAFKGDHVMAVLTKVLFDEPPPLTDLVPDIDPALAQLAARMLSKDPAGRPRDGTAVAGELANVAVGEASGIRAEPTAMALPSLTATEQRLHCVVLAAASDVAAPSVTGTALMATVEQTGGTLSELRAEVVRFGGRLERLLDGSIAITLLGSGAATDQVAQAARCALAVRVFLPRVPIALATGRGVVAERWPMGEAIDRAARLLRGVGIASAATPAYGAMADVSPASLPTRGVLLDEPTAALLDARFEVVGDVDGRDGAPSQSGGGAGSVIELLAERPVGEGARTLLGRATPCVGRERELSTLEALYDECVEEQVARAVIVVGPVGVGKSRLRYELARRLAVRESPPQLWIARGDPMSAGSPFGLLAQVLRRTAGLEAGEPPEAAREKLAVRVAGAGGSPEEDARIAEFLGEIVGAHFPDEASVQLRAARQDALLMGDQIRRAWEDFAARECAAHPVLLVLEDLHWGDLPTVKLVDAVLRNLHDRPFMVVALGRPELSDVFPTLWADRSAAVMGVGELTRKAAERLVRQVLGPDVAAETVALIADRAQGNAFYLEELIRAVAGGERERLPETILAMVQARLDALEPAARHVLRAASVFGQVFWGEGVRRLLGGAERTAEVRDWLAELAQREVVTARPAGRFPKQPEYVFRHALLREAAYSMLTDADRSLGHRLAGEWLASVGEGDALVLAEHFERGGEPARSVDLYRRAAEQALEGDDLVAAIARAERGVRCGAAGESLGRLRLLQAEAQGWRAEHAEAAVRSREAMDLLPRATGPWFEAAGQLAEATRGTGTHEHLVSLAAELGSTRPGRTGREPWVKAVALTVASLFAVGRYETATALHDNLEDLESSLDAPEPAIRAWIDNSRSWKAMYAGDVGACLALDANVVRSFEAVGDLRNACLQRASVAYDMLVLGADLEAEAALRGILVMAARMGLITVSAVAKHNLGLALGRLGRVDEARAMEAEAVRLFDEQGNWRLAGASRIYLSQILLLSGDARAAEQEAVAALEILRSSPPIRVQAFATLAAAHLALGNVHEARQAAEEASKLMEELGDVEEGEAQARLVLAETLAAMEDPRAVAALEAARKRLLERAARIGDAAWRQSFLERVPENARTLALAAEWGI